MKPAWFKLVHDYQANVVGPTIPFLLGALRTPPGVIRDGLTSRAELHDLLVAMRDEPAPKDVTIQPCVTPDKLVVTTQEPSGSVIRLPSAASPGRGLNFMRINQLDFPNIESLTQALWDVYGGHISAGRFSLENGIWRPFTQHEVRLIEHALQ